MAKKEPVMENKEEKPNILANVIKILFGLILVIAGVISYVYWWQDLLVLIRGGLGLFLFLVGFVFIALGWSEMH